MFEALDKTKQGTELKILTPKQMLQRLLIAPAQEKVGNNSKKLLNKIRQIFYSLYRSKEITKKVYNNNQINPVIIENTIFMNSEKGKTSKPPHALIVKLNDKLDLRRGEKSIALSDLRIYYTWKNIKISYNSNNFKISAPTLNDTF